MGADGLFYFVTTDGGRCNVGRIWRVADRDGGATHRIERQFRFSVLPGRHEIDPTGKWIDGRRRWRIVWRSFEGGANGTGGLYRVGLDGTLSTRASFPAGQSGQRDALTLGTDGRLYGTAANFSLASFIYRVDPQSGLVETLYEFPTGPSSARMATSHAAACWRCRRTPGGTSRSSA